MITLFLTLHIAGSFVFIAYAAVAVYKLIVARGNEKLMKRAAVIIGLHQVITGFGLAFLSPNMSILTVCMRGIILVGILYGLSTAVTRRLAFAKQIT